ncbi:MAG: glyoxalase/bleomycin resistance/dioxygenase family protein [Nitrospira sp.]
MKRFHIHVGVETLDESIRFYSALFGAEPVKTKTDYAKWLLEDPRVNFAISTREKKNGVDHLGIQVEESQTVCCYARSDKSWIQDPAGIPWEAYRTIEDAQLFSGHSNQSEGAYCTPETMGQPDCCEPSEKPTGSEAEIDAAFDTVFLCSRTA